MKSLVTLQLSRPDPANGEEPLRLVAIGEDTPKPLNDTWSTEGIRVVPFSLSGAEFLLASSKQPSYASEEYRIIRTKLIHMLNKPFRLAVTSASVGDGKTLTAVNLSIAMAMTNSGKTLLIDADMRRGDVHCRLQIANEPGLTDVLIGRCELREAIVQATQLPDLYVLPAGKAPANIGEVLNSTKWRELGDQVASQFPHTIVDCPPVELFADYDLIAEICDMTVLVVRPDHTDRTLLTSALKKLPPKLAGIILNATGESMFDKRTSRRYHHYYRAKYGTESE